MFFSSPVVDVVEIGGAIAVTCFLLFFVVLVGIQLNLQINSVKGHLRINPNATAPLTGELTNEGLRLESESRISWRPHEGLTSCQVKNNQLSLCHNPQGLGLRILPVRGFSNPTQAVQFLEFQANKVSPSPNVLEPVTRPSMVGAPPADAIAFGGILKGGDFTKSPLEAIRKLRVKRSFIVLLGIIVLLTLAFAFVFNSAIGLAVGGAVCVLVLFFMFLRMTKTIGPEVPLIAFQGWLNEREIASLDNSGHIRYSWKDYQSVGSNDACIWLKMYGYENALIILPRHFFTDYTQWQAAVRIAASHSTKHLAGSS